jgi:hypothetical protein
LTLFLALEELPLFQSEKRRIAREAAPKHAYSDEQTH